jgi:hypothetical protein
MRGYSRNPQRILKVFYSEKTFTPSEIIEMFPELHKSTVYRNISKLVLAGNIKAVIKDGSIGYVYKKN